MIPFASLAATLALALLAAAPAAASGDAAKGEKVFKKCAACHAVGEGAKNKVGPQLNGVLDRKMASVEGFKYSEPFKAKAAEGAVWTAEELDAYLEKPADWLKGNKMSFAGLRKEDERADVIAYLAGFK